MNEILREIRVQLYYKTHDYQDNNYLAKIEP